MAKDTTAETALAPDEVLSARLAERGRRLALPGVWEPPPGDPILHHTAGFAKTLCSAVFITGLDPDDAAANVGGFTAPFEYRDRVVEREIDHASETVRLTLDNGVVRTARRYKSQGCITHPLDHDGIFFTPSDVVPNTPDPATTAWPMGDVLPDEPLSSEIDQAVLDEAVAAAMHPDGMTLGFLVTHRGRIVAERYADGLDHHTPFESWSMGKSVIGTLMGTLIQDGAYDLWQEAPIPEWQSDQRREIRIGDIMRMSSGIRAVAMQDPEYKPEMGYPDHLYFYTGGINAFEYAATRPQQWLPNTVGRYRNCDPVLASYLIRLAVEARGENYHAFPQRKLFDKLGISHFTLETDPYGNFLTQGYEFATSRDWARLANLYLNDGVWNGERLLPEGYVDYAFETAPAWQADGRPIYGGGFLWKNRGFPIDEDFSFFAGAGGQYAIIIPSRDLVIVRHGKYRGVTEGTLHLNRAITKVLAAISPSAS